MNKERVFLIKKITLFLFDSSYYNFDEYNF
jgi:hypothetical protein